MKKFQMMRIRQFTYAVFLLLSIFVSPVSARNLSTLYSQSELGSARDRYSPNLQWLFREDFLTRLLLKERMGAPNARLETPLLGQGKSPWDFYALIRRQTIVMPILSVKFLDDLSITYAYMERHNCSKELFHHYLTKLIYDKNYVPSPPRMALGIPPNALDDHFVDDVSQKLLKSTIFFLIGHEYAHILYRHADYSQISGAKAQSQEMQSDDFSLNVMRRIGVAPMGLSFFFSVASRLERVPASFNMKSDFDRYIRQGDTHPLTGDRVRNIARYIRNHARDFAKLELNRVQTVDSLKTISSDVAKIGEIIHDGKFRRFQLEKGLEVTSAQLRRACN